MRCIIMLFSQTFFYLLMGLGTAVGLPALWLFTRAKWPAMVERNRNASTRRLLVSLLVGLPVVVAVLLVAKGLSTGGKPVFQIANVLLLGGTLLWSLAGLAGLATHVGEILWPQFKTGDEAWRATWKGGLVVVGCLLIPFIGWFFLLLLMPVLGAGIQVRSWFGRRQANLPQPVAAPPLPSALVPGPPSLPQA